MTHQYTKLADALESYTGDGHGYQVDDAVLREAARILRAAAAVDVAGLMELAEAMANAAYASAVDYINGAGADATKEVEARAALESALRMALAGREEWQPIETAPKDVAVLLWGKYWNNKDVFQRPLVGQWNPISNPQRWAAMCGSRAASLWAPCGLPSGRTERNTMSREAFEAWFKPTFYDDCAWSESRNCYVEPSVHMAWKGWQAAIQHASDEAEDCIEHELGETGQAKAIVHAIKEALK